MLEQIISDLKSRDRKKTIEAIKAIRKAANSSAKGLIDSTDRLTTQAIQTSFLPLNIKNADLWVLADRILGMIKPEEQTIRVCNPVAGKHNFNVGSITMDAPIADTESIDHQPSNHQILVHSNS